MALPIRYQLPIWVGFNSPPRRPVKPGKATSFDGNDIVTKSLNFLLPFSSEADTASILPVDLINILVRSCRIVHTQDN